MEMNNSVSFSSSSSSDYVNQHRDPDIFVDQTEAKFSSEFNRQLQLNNNGSSDSRQLFTDSDVHDDDPEEEDQEHFVDCEDDEETDEEEEDDDDDGDFTFMYVGENNSPISADKVFEDGQIRPVFPLFDQNLLLGDDCEIEGRNRLPIRPPVDKIFIESPHRSSSSTASEVEEIDGIASGPYCVWSKESATDTPELSQKSNSTGFSKLWRFRDKVGRSNSGGRDAYVFLNSSGRTKLSSSSTSTSKEVAKPTAVEESSVKVNATGEGKAKVVKKRAKAKNATAAAHEVYLRKRGEQTGEERRRSYLPYRPELMGFFTNVNGGLSRNVHPF